MNIHFGMEGLFTFEVFCSKNGKSKRKYKTFPNLITNWGLDRIASGGVLNGCVVGTGTAPELPTDQALQSRIGPIAAQPAPTNSASTGGSPYYTSQVSTYSFAANTVVGNITEVGIVGNPSSPNQLWSRSLVKDGSGNPTTITILADEVLQVTYELRTYLNENIVSGGPVVLDLQNYNYRIAPINVRSLSVWATGSGFSSGGVIQPYSGTLQTDFTAVAPNGSPVGSAPNAARDAGYVSGSYKQNVRFSFSIAQGNGTWQTLRLQFSQNSPIYQIEIDRPFTKTSAMTMQWVFTYSWGRREI